MQFTVCVPGWSSEQIKALVLHQGFQELLADLRDTQTKYRKEFVDKPKVLMFPFHKVRLWCFYECTLLKALQMIGVDATFDFDVSLPNPPWMDANEDGILTVPTKRNLRHDEDAAAAAVAKVQQGMLMMGEMGICARFGDELCRNMLIRNKCDVNVAVEALWALSGQTRGWTPFDPV
jgi:hypothetical protein